MDCSKNEINEARLTRMNDRWSNFLLCQPSEIDELPKKLEVVCDNEKCRRRRMIETKWTAQEPAKFLVPQAACNGCNKKVLWKPIDPSFQVINNAILSKLWTRLNSHIDPTQYPRRPDIYFRSGTMADRAAELRAAKKALENKVGGMHQ